MNRPTSLKLQWPGGERTVAQGETVRIGRDASCEVVIDDPNVSRRHVEIRSGADGWMLVDPGSTQGTYIDGQKVGSQRIDRSFQAVLGRVGPGVTLSVTVVPGTPAPGTPGLDDAVTEHVRPGGQLRAEVLDGATVVTTDQIAVECGGRSYRFDPGPERIIGRDDAADVVSSNPTVSRRHAVLRHTEQGWMLEDLGSSGGTYLDGRRVSHVSLRGSNSIWLGDPESGERIVAVASGVRERSTTERLGRFARSGRGALVLLGAVVVALGLSAFALASRGDDSSPSPDRLALASVHLVAGNFAGSGTVVDAEHGLILTNAHVVAPAAAGTGVRDLLVERSLDEEVDEVLIGVTDGLDRSAEIRYRGEVVAVDGFLDLAVVKITKLGSGSLIEDGDLDGLVEVDLGDSDDVSTGDPVRVIGYPGVSQSDAPTLTQGVIAGSVRDDRLGTNRGYINIDADISPGNSGGAAFDDGGRLVGVPTLLNLDVSTVSKSNRIRPVNLARPLIDAAVKGEAYSSPFFTELTGDEKITSVRSIAPTDRTGFTPQCAGSGFDVRPGDSFVSMAVGYEGFADAAHQDLMARIVSGDQVIGLVTTGDQYPFDLGTDGCVTLTADLFDANGNPTNIPTGTYAVQFFAGPNYRFLGQLPFAVPGVIGAGS